MVKKHQSNARREEELFATLIKSTHTQRRGISLIEFATRLAEAIEHAGSLDAVAERIVLSPRMLKQFTLVARLSPEVRSLVSARKIDSVDAVGYLIQFGPKEQLFLARKLIEGKILTSDLRAVRQICREKPSESLQNVIDRVIATRTKKVYVLEFIFRGGLTEERVRRRILDIVAREELVAVEREGSFGRLVLTAAGLAKLRQGAANERVTLSKFLAATLND